ncbi:GAF domain-containing protein [Pseudonocardia petroleophila]|uniref:GAF domain-containing protein n=1 Tax=Pseudonocardia petroleophila TaxID=37331 RepID=A0A7G7MPX0_9PSEU|nr:helix-turn-helix domain-containing protein [Pseudonocardia petroleophila]QNG54831.1 GAF domain-containing protein [Pseudonocardia petroleophila]
MTTRGEHGTTPVHDPVEHARVLHGIYDSALTGGSGGRAPRSLVSASWQRSLAAHVDPDRHTPPAVFAEDDLSEVRETHPLNDVLPLLRSTLVSIADEAMHVMLVTDADGTILWREGAARLLHIADDTGLSPGFKMSEDAIGTNAMGTTLAIDAPVQIHSAEHLVRAFHAWTCAAAPVHDPDTGAILGAIDISGPLHTVHPAMVQLVSATAQLAENQLRVRLAIADERLRVRNMPHLTSLRGQGALVTPTGRIVAGEPYGTWPERVALPQGSDRVLLDDGREMVVEPLAEGYLLRTPRPARAARRSALSLRFMGEAGPRVVLNGKTVQVTLRPAEILTALALHPDGLTAERLALLLYGDDGNPTTVRGEILRLRGLIGADVLRTRPYRLDAAVDTDFDAVRTALRKGNAAEALRACAGPLLPRSDAPEIRELRDQLEVGLRRAVLDADDVDLLAELAAHPLGRDELEVHDLLAERLPADDRRRPEVLARRARLLAED